MIITVANTYEPGTVLGTSLYKLIYLSQQPYGGRDIIIIQFTDEETKAQRGWVRASLDSRAHPYLPHPSVSCNCSYGWWFVSTISPLSAELPECRLYLLYFHCYIPSAQLSRKLRLCFQVMYLAQSHSAIKGQSKMSTQDQSPCNFHHAVKLPVLGEEHLGVALQKLKCLKKKQATFELLSFESCRRW